MKKGVTIVLVAVLLLTGSISASACTMIYVGGDMTADGSCIYGRVEDCDQNDFRYQ